MKVFISWSGERSLAIAKALRDWLPRVIQAIEPWMSDSDADKGIRWEQRIGQELEQTRFGIFCLTPENLDSRWLNFFEAGAIAKTVDKTYVCTYLRDLKPTDIEGPLSQFNHTKTEKEDTRKLIHTVNRALEPQSLDEKIVNDSFDTYWPRLEKDLNELPAASEKRKPRNVEDMTEEILVSVRALLQQRSMSSSADISSSIAEVRPAVLGSTLTPRGKRIVGEHYNLSKEAVERSAFYRDDLRELFIKSTGRDLGLGQVRETRDKSSLENLFDEEEENENPNQGR